MQNLDWGVEILFIYPIADYFGPVRFLLGIFFWPVVGLDFLGFYAGFGQAEQSIFYPVPILA